MSHSRSEKFFTEGELQIMEETYNKPGRFGSFAVIGRMFGVDDSVVKRQLVKRGIKLKSHQESNRSKQCDINYFESIDTQEKAYWLGFLYADGCIGEYKTYGKYLTLGLTDGEMVEEFKLAIKSDHPVKYRHRSGHAPFYSLKIGSKKLYEDLVNKGCIPKKTYNLHMPTRDQVPLELMGHFLRGFFDGDGCIHVSTKRQVLYASISVNQTFADDLCCFLFDKLGIQKNHNKNRSIRQIQMTGEKMYKFLDYIYKDATVFLARKKNIYDKYRKDK